MTATVDKKQARQLPILQGILPLDRARISTDIIAGLTLAALAATPGHNLASPSLPLQLHT